MDNILKQAATVKIPKLKIHRESKEKRHKKMNTVVFNLKVAHTAIVLDIINPTKQVQLAPSQVIVQHSKAKT